MSAHYVEKRKPPPGLTSFTRIRLGWIGPGQVKVVKSEETGQAFLSPLEKKGRTLVVKIPLRGGKYYLVENRQPIGFDQVLPDSGILILKVNPEAVEGAGTVEVMDADPGSPNLSRATYKLNQVNRNRFLDKKNNLAVIPLWSQGEAIGVLVTSGQKSDLALKAALGIQELKNHYQGSGDQGTGQRIKKAIGAFRKAQFNTCVRITDQGMK